MDRIKVKDRTAKGIKTLDKRLVQTQKMKNDVITTKEKIENKDFEVSERIRLMQNQVNKYERLIKKVPENIIEKIQKKEKNRKNRER